ncbi:hypothetical protein [Ostreiculturibacter nitratireducens]
MTNRIAIWIVALVAAIFLLDYFLLGWGLLLVLGRILDRLVEWLAFWR